MNNELFILCNQSRGVAPKADWLEKANHAIRSHAKGVPEVLAGCGISNMQACAIILYSEVSAKVCPDAYGFIRILEQAQGNWSRMIGDNNISISPTKKFFALLRESKYKEKS